MSIFDLANFVENEMTLVSDPLYSRDAVSQYIEKNQKFIKSKRFTFSTVKAEKLGKVDISKKLKVGNRCPVCNENHDIEDCVFFLHRHLKNEASYFIRENYIMDVFKKSSRSIMQNLVQNRRI